MNKYEEDNIEEQHLKCNCRWSYKTIRILQENIKELIKENKALKKDIRVLKKQIKELKSK